MMCEAIEVDAGELQSENYLSKYLHSRHLQAIDHVTVEARQVGVNKKLKPSSVSNILQCTITLQKYWGFF